jgi:hypothetical protein
MFPSFVISQESDRKALIEKFDAFVLDNYYKKIHKDPSYYDARSIKITARISGYALGQQLRFIEKGTRHHRDWLFLEKYYLEKLDDLVENEGRRSSASNSVIERAKRDMREQFIAASQGWYNDQMAIVTGIAAGEAPRFFGPEDEEDPKEESILEDYLLGEWVSTSGNKQGLKFVRNGNRLDVILTRPQASDIAEGYSAGDVYHVLVNRIDNNTFVFRHYLYKDRRDSSGYFFSIRYSGRNVFYAQVENADSVKPQFGGPWRVWSENFRRVR